MHELSIAESVLRIVDGHARGRQVTKVTLRVGHLRQVVPSALDFAFELVAQGTVAEGAALEIEEVPLRGVCRACEADTEQAGFPLRCGRCGGFDIEVVSGEELLVDSLEVEETVATSGGLR
jgi:hydrogenase nickel incorporation protein HypA/HybF